MIPPGDPPAREGALALFDRELRDSRDWQGWENNKVHKYAIRAGDRLYPVKQIVSLATGMPVSEFSGGEGSGQANNYVRDRGFEVVPLRQRNPKWPRDELILALDLYLRHRPHLPEKNSPQIQQLSNILNQIGAALGVHGDSSFRNNSGVYMKLKIFHRLDTDYTTEGEVGLTRGGKDEEDVWQEFAQNPDHCYRVAQAIRAAIDQAEVLPVKTADEDTDDYYYFVTFKQAADYVGICGEAGSSLFPVWFSRSLTNINYNAMIINGVLWSHSCCLYYSIAQPELI